MFGSTSSRPVAGRTRAVRGALLALAAGLLLLPACDKARSDSVAMVNRGVVAYQNGEPEVAGDYFRRAIQLFPENDVAHYHLGLIDRYDRHDLDAARKHFMEAYRLNADNPDAAFQLGTLFLDDGKLDTAQGYIERALKGDPRNHQAQYQLGRIFEQKRKFAQADAAYRRAIELYALYPVAFHALGSLYLQFDEVDAAVAVLEEGVRLNDDSADLHAALGLARMEKDDFAGARHAFELAISIEPQRPLYFYNLGVALEREGRAREAIEILRKFVEASKPEHAVQVKLARAVVDRLMIELDARTRARELGEAPPPEPTPEGGDTAATAP